MKLKCVNLLSFLLLLSVVRSDALPAQAGESTYDKLWQLAELYASETNPVVQGLDLSGRFQHEHARVWEDDRTYDEWNVRRARLGVNLDFFREFTLHIEAGFNPQETDPFYLRLTDAFLQWSPTSRAAVKVGKQGVPFTMDGSTSSKELLTIDRSNLANNMWFPQEYLPGVSFSGEASNWVYRVGAYSAGERNREFGRLNAGVVTLAVLGYDAAEELGVASALLRGTYVHQNPDLNNTFTRQLRHVASVNFEVEDGWWGLRSDITTARGYLGQSDLWGATIMPFLNVVAGLQFVGRYTYLSSEGANGVRLPRYENKLVDGRGDRYDEVYLGVNYYFYGHKLKLQGGVNFANMEDRANDGGGYSGVAATTGLRVSW